MADCPRCAQTVDSSAVTCPHCHLTLKAYGHPGITLHQAVGDNYLCATCTYEADDTCTFPQRPYAKECTLYEDVSKPPVSLAGRSTSPYSLSLSRKISLWLKQNPVWIALVGLVVISFVVSLL